MNLTRLVYYSQRNPSVDMDVDALIKGCKRKHIKQSLTGMLHYNGDYFVQVIEGGRVDVSALFHQIVRDVRHSNVILLSFSDVRERLFSTQPMGLRQGMDKQSRAIFLRYFASTVIDPETVNVDALLDALHDLMVEVSEPTKLTISV